MSVRDPESVAVLLDPDGAGRPGPVGLRAQGVREDDRLTHPGVEWAGDGAGSSSKNKTTRALARAYRQACKTDWC